MPTITQRPSLPPTAPSFRRWQHLISGSIFDELKHILGAAGPGQMCVSEEVWHRLERCDGVATRVEGASCGDGSGVFRVEKIRYHELSKVEKWVASVEMPLPQEIEQCARAEATKQLPPLLRFPRLPACFFSVGDWLPIQNPPTMP